MARLPRIVVPRYPIKIVTLSDYFTNLETYLTDYNSYIIVKNVNSAH